MGGMDGLTLFDEIRKQAPTLPVIILTAHGHDPRCGRRHAPRVFGFQSKRSTESTCSIRWNRRCGFRSRPGEGEEDWRRDFVTQSPKMENVLHQRAWLPSRMRACSSRERAVRERELLARAIHRASHRSQGPFVAVNCAAFPEICSNRNVWPPQRPLPVRATITRAHPRADGGDAVFDEIGERCPFALQAKQFRFEQIFRDGRAIDGYEGSLRGGGSRGVSRARGAPFPYRSLPG